MALKSSPLRKRYFLVHMKGANGIRAHAERIARTTGTAMKFIHGEYFILLTNQIDKHKVSDIITREFPSASIITVSGTIKKCKRIIEYGISASSPQQPPGNR